MPRIKLLPPNPRIDFVTSDGKLTATGMQVLQQMYNALLGTASFPPANLSSGTGSPNGAVVGSVGDLFSRTDGGAGTTLYVKESGASTNAGWVAK